MPIYTAAFRTDAEHATLYDLVANSPEHALQLAHTLWETNADAIDWSRYERLQSLNDIEIFDGDDAVVASWIDPDCQLQLAAGDLLAALQLMVSTFAPNHESDFHDFGLDHFVIARAAIAKAQAGAK